MSDFIGRVAVPVPTASGLTFPLVSDFGYGTARPWPIIEHRFGELTEKASQRFLVGIGPRKFQFKRSVLSHANRATLLSFFESVQGSYQSFTYNAPNADKTTTAYTVIFETTPLTIAELTNACQTGITFVEVPSTNPSYSISETDTRFPSSTLQSALLSQVQQIIPLVHIKVRESAVSDIYLSDRRCTVGGQQYLPRLLNLGEPGSDAIMSQDIKGSADNVTFQFGNADRVMTALANDTDLKYASIDLCLYHVQSGCLIQMWKGFVQSFTGDGSSRFTMQCSDGLFQIMQQYPTRTISRTCWKTFNDGLNCPYSVHGSGGDANSCDYTFSGTNGCASHGMSVYFGGIDVPQQMAIGHSGGNRVTNTSIVSDNMWGKALPDIWCNQNNDLPSGADPLTQVFNINATMAVVRDESGFIDSLGIIGAGPIGEYSVAPTFSGKFVTNADQYSYFVGPTVDGFPAHGWKGNSSNTGGTNNPIGAPRQVVGNDPAATNEPFGLTGVGGTEPGSSFAAGAAFVELRYQTGSTTANPTVPEQHTMLVPLAKGLSGWVWDSAGNRTLVAGLTNPFWIAVNTYLRALGLQSASSATQLQYFVLSSVVNVDGVSGAAQIADNTVANILGAGSGIQFQFQGILDTQKPVRDWLTEIVACALGYFSFQFGRLFLGCRINASAVEAFTRGNMLYQSLRLQPIEAAFEHLVISYADQQYQYQNNTADYQDKDHALYYGRPGSPLTARQNSVGCPTLNQALRLAVTRVREEVGGVSGSNNFNNGTSVDPTEWRNARIATWNTTILGLNTAVGQVVSITHPDVPGGSGDFRIQNWRLNKDWSLTITAKSVTASMYDLDVGPKPADVKAPPPTALIYPVPDQQWQPMEIQAYASDPTFPDEWTFDINQSYRALADGTSAAGLTVTGILPVNLYIDGCPAPLATSGAIAVTTTGGHLPGGQVYKVSVACTDGNGNWSPPSPTITILTPTGTSTNKFVLSGIQWPNFAGLTDYTIFISNNDDLIAAQQSGALTGTTTGGVTTYTPTAITVNGPLVRTSWALPDSNLSAVRLKLKLLVHGGVQGSAVTSVSGSTVTCSESVDFALTDNWAGRRLIVIGRDDETSIPYASFNITAFDPATGAFTLDRAAVVAMHPEQSIQVDDAVVVTFQGYDNHLTPRVFADAGMSNSQDLPTPHTGLTPDAEIGNILRVLWGTGRGQTAKVIANEATSYTLDQDFVIGTDSIICVEYPTWQYTSTSSAIKNPNNQTVTSLVVPSANFLQQSMLVAGFTVDAQGVETGEDDAVIRMSYLYGDPGTVADSALIFASTP